jgi:DNA-binding Lrp family transcriptional regulator
MTTAIILLKVERKSINNAAQRLADMEGISEVYSVSGKYDLVAIARVRHAEDLADLVTRRMLVIEDVRESETMLAFQTFSRHDLDTMFSSGFNEA